MGSAAGLSTSYAPLRTEGRVAGPAGHKAPQDRYLEVGPDRIRIRYWDEGSGSPVLLLHGLGGAAEYWRRNVWALAEGHRTVAIDLPGFGRSQKQLPRVSPGYAVEFLMWLADALKIPRMHLVARSLSGYIALRFALVHPERLRRLVIVAGAGLGRELPLALRLLNVPLLGELLYRPTRWSLRIRERALYHEPAQVTDAWLEKLEILARQPGAKEFALRVVRMGSDLGGQRRQLYEPLLHRLREIEAETLVVWGAQDRMVPLSHGYRLAAHLPRAQLRILDDCGHQPQIERVEEFNELVLDFLG